MTKKAPPFIRNVFVLYRAPPLVPESAENEQGVLDKLKTETVRFLHDLFVSLDDVSVTLWVPLCRVSEVSLLNFQSN